MSDLYDDDVLVWSEHQGALLRRVADGDAPNEAPDWSNIIEEVESVGRSQLNAVRSHLLQALLHDLKVRAWPHSPYVRHWQDEAAAHRDDAIDLCTPAMRQRIEVDDLYRRAMRRLPRDIDGQPPLPVPEACPLTLDELLHAP